MQVMYPARGLSCGGTLGVRGTSGVIHTVRFHHLQRPSGHQLRLASGRWFCGALGRELRKLPRLVGPSGKERNPGTEGPLPTQHLA